jgi:NADH-quinone oxidoreductase subunit A
MNNLIALSLMALVVGGLAALVIWITTVLGPKSMSAVKSQPFEMGEVPFRIVKGHIPVQFYLVALLFVVFDVELTFLFPWALIFRELGI